jgi:hypothetical protein
MSFTKENLLRRGGNFVSCRTSTSGRSCLLNLAEQLGNADDTGFSLPISAGAKV